MKTFSILICLGLCLILSVQQSMGLQCYSCLAATSHAGCTNVEQCADTSYCYTIRASVLGASTYSKGCLAACATTSTGTEATGSQTTCCQTDNCNSHAVSLKPVMSLFAVLAFLVMPKFF